MESGWRRSRTITRCACGTRLTGALVATFEHAHSWPAFTRDDTKLVCGVAYALQAYGRSPLPWRPGRIVLGQLRFTHNSNLDELPAEVRRLMLEELEEQAEDGH